MARRFRHLQGAATSLPVLESVVRLGSFSRAGGELGLTQPTVSRHIQALERLLGLPLFLRNNNRIKPTPAARELAAATDAGFSQVEQALARLGQAARPAEARMCCGFTFANLWMMPRFADLRRSLGDHRVSLTVSFWMENLRREEFEILIDWMEADVPGWTRRPLFDECVYPVATPNLARRLALSPGDAAPLLKSPLLRFEERGPTAGWTSWFESLDLPDPSPAGEYRHSNYQLMLQSVLEGEGVGLGWHHLVTSYFADGSLVRVGPVWRNERRSLCLALRNGALPSPLVGLLTEWFATNVEATRI